MKLAPALTFLLAICASTMAVAKNQPPVDGQYPPPTAPTDLKWDNLLTGKLADQWTGMSMPVNDATLTTRPNPDHAGEYILHVARAKNTGLIRSMKPYENFILEFEWRHLTAAPNAGGGKDPKTGETTSGNSGLLIAHGPFPKPNGPYPGEGHEIQVCNLGNGSWYTSNGDTFTLPGTTSTAIPDPRFAVSHACGHRSMPIEFHAHKTGEWNKIRITCVDGVIQHEINGFLATTLYRASPRKGYISFESEGAPTEFRNMRIHELAPDPELSQKHVAPLLPEKMACDYITDKSKPIAMPHENFIAVLDAHEKIKLSALISGLELPETEISGRVMISVKDHFITVASNDKPVLEKHSLSTEQIETHAGVIHPEAGKFGHVLLLTPVK